MYAEISPETAGRYSLSRFTDDYGKAQETATVTKVTTGEVSASDADGREVAVMPVSFDTNAFGQVSGELQLPLDGDRVAWSPNLVFPGLGEGDRLIRRTRLPERAPILARDGTPLAEGPVTARSSPLGTAAVGEVSSPSPEQNTEQVQHGFPPDTPTGTSGLELAFNDRLAGQPGGQLVAAPPSQGGDAAKSTVIATSKPVAGTPVHTTIDPKLQRAATAALGGQYGGVAVLDATDGSVLALAGIALSGPQPPGSTFKVITTTAALDAGVVKLTDQFPIQTATVVGGREVANAHNEACGGSFVDRHRNGARAHRDGAAGRPRRVRDRHFRGADRASGELTGPAPRARSGRATGSSPTICVRPASFSPMACCRRTKGAAMSCGGSCAGRCATRICSGAKEPLMHRLVPALVGEMGQAFPNWSRAQAADRGSARARGNALPPDARDGPEAARRGDGRPWARATLPGETAFKLYDTYGFPYDLTEDALRAAGIAVDRAGLRCGDGAAEGRGPRGVEGLGPGADGEVWFDIAERKARPSSPAIGATSGEGQVVALVAGGKEVPLGRQAGAKRRASMTNQTPFYGESGGQIGDAGTITGDGRPRARHQDTTKPLGRLHAHHGTVAAGAISRRRHRSSGGRLRAARRGSAPTTRRPTCSTRRCAIISANMSRRRARSLPRTGCGSTFRTPRPLSAGRHRRGRSRGECRDPPQRRGHHAADDARRGDRRGRDGAVRREIRRRSARARDGPASAMAATPIRSSCAAAPTSARPATSACFAIVAESAVAAGVRRIEALTGEAARQWLIAREDALEGGRRRAQGLARRGRGARRRRWSRSASGWSANWPRRRRRWRSAAAGCGVGGRPTKRSAA